MLSRMLSSRGSSIAARSLTRFAAIPSVRTEEFNRSFNSSAPLRQAPAAAVEGSGAAVEGSGPKSIVDSYGFYTFWGSIAAIAVSKEIFIIDAEFLLSMEIGAFALTSYVLAGDTINKMSEEMDKAKTDKFAEVNDFMLTMLDQYKMVQQTAQDKPAVMDQYLQEYKDSCVAHAKYQTVLPQHAARAQVLAALDQVKNREAHAAAAEWAQSVENAVDNVRTAFEANDAKLQGEMLELAISNMGPTVFTTTEKNDPVKRLFMQQFTDDQ